MQWNCAQEMQKLADKEETLTSSQASVTHALARLEDQLAALERDKLNAAEAFTHETATKMVTQVLFCSEFSLHAMKCFLQNSAAYAVQCHAVSS